MSNLTLPKVLQEIEDEKSDIEYIGKALKQIVQLYIETEKKLLGKEEEEDKTVLDSVNDLWAGVTYRAMALGEGGIDTAVDGIIGAYKLLVEPVGRLGLLFKDWNLRGFGFISEEEWQKRESQYCEYANGLTSGISDTLLNVFNFKNLEENTILSPFAYCYNHFGEYISSDASYEDMVGYSKNVVNSVATAALVKKAATSLKPKMKNLKNSRPLPNADVSKTVTPSTKVAGKTVDEGHNVVNYAKLKEQYRVTELANDVVDSLQSTGQLPSNYITKAQAQSMGWSTGKALNNYAPGKAIGGDIFSNSTGVLPSAAGRTWVEADVGMNYMMGRNKNPGYRIVFSNDGLIYGTFDHYNSVFQIGTY